MNIFGSYKNLTFTLSVAFVCLYFANLSLAFISYQVNDRIFTYEKEKYFLRIAKSMEQARLLKENEVKKRLMKENEVKRKTFNVLSKYRTGLNPVQLRQTARVIHQEGKKFGYDPMFLVALIVTESSAYNWAVSNVGARGLMQLMPFTAEEIASETALQWKGKKTLYDPLLNIKMGTYYLGKMESKFGNLQLALEAYNQGPKRLNKMLNRGYLPTRYSNKVFSAYERIKQGRI
jgi:soluble lytic murein transglycosylase